MRSTGRPGSRRSYGPRWAGRAQEIHDLIAEGLNRSDLAATERLASTFARIRHGIDEEQSVLDPSLRLLSQGKLAHDLLQLEHLKRTERLGPRLDEAIGAYEAALETFGTAASETRRPIDPERESSSTGITGASFTSSIVHAFRQPCPAGAEEMWSTPIWQTDPASL
jgi:hypothetical protein